MKGNIDSKLWFLFYIFELKRKTKPFEHLKKKFFEYFKVFLEGSQYLGSFQMCQNPKIEEEMRSKCTLRQRGFISLVHIHISFGFQKYGKKIKKTIFP